MEALNFLRFWRATTVAPAVAASAAVADIVSLAVPVPLVVTDDESEQEEEDSYFDLELWSSRFDDKENANANVNTTPGKDCCKERTPKGSVKRDGDGGGGGGPKVLQPTPLLPRNDFLSKRKVLPIEPPSKPQSPIALLKSAPKLGAFRFKKPTHVAGKENREKRRLGAMFKLDETPNAPKLGGGGGGVLRKHPSEVSLLDDSTSKRFSKDVIHKYLNVFKPFYVRLSRKNNERGEFSGGLSAAPAAVLSSPPKKQGNAPAGFRVVCNHLGKSKSASVAMGATSPSIARRDDSLLQQHEGIQGAILHCKRSFNSSSDSPLLLRATSDPLQRKST